MRSRATRSPGTMIMAPSLRSWNGIACRSRSLMMAAESSSDRSENSIVICGADIRKIMKAKKPISATATATIAAIRAAPSDFKNSTSPFTDPTPGSDLPGKNCPVDGYRRVNERVTKPIIGSGGAGLWLLDHFDHLRVLRVDDEYPALGDIQTMRFDRRYLLRKQRRYRLERDLGREFVTGRHLEIVLGGLDFELL